MSITYGLTIVMLVLLVAAYILIYLFMYQSVKMVNSFNTNGLIIFKIDPSRKSVMRISSQSLSGSLNFDDPVYGMELNSIVNLDDFIKYFDDKKQKIVHNYLLSKDFTQSLNVYTKLTSNNFLQSELYLNFKKLRIDIKNKEFLVKFYPSQKERKYYCTIHWNTSPRSQYTSNFSKIKESSDLLKLPYNYYLSYAFTIDDYFYNKNLNSNETNQIIKAFKLSKYQGSIYYKHGILQLIVGTNFYGHYLKLLKRAIKTVEYQNKYRHANPFFNNVALISFTKLEKEKDIELLNNKAKFLLYNLENNNTSKNYNFWFYNDNKFSAEFNDFIDKLTYFESKNLAQDFIKETYYVKKYSNDANTNIKVLKCRVSGFSNEEMNFFKNIGWFKLNYTSIWNQYLLQNEKSTDRVLIPTNEADFKHLVNYTRPNTTLVLVPSQTDYNYNFITNGLNTLWRPKINEGISIGLYIDDLNERIFNLIQLEGISTYIISKSICKYIVENNEIFLKLQVLIQKIHKDENTLVIFENLPKNIEDIIVKKLNIKYYYNINN
ncbi:MHO_4530 family protein [Mycoplasmopsis adleri]|uniref:MHO_4530 family protein n=1 Tax=Mycoplasmopsis adleri TaxID=51362 RepID=UPI0038731150